MLLNVRVFHIVYLLPRFLKEFILLKLFLITDSSVHPESASAANRTDADSLKSAGMMAAPVSTVKYSCCQ
jgi:hypothetical protein